MQAPKHGYFYVLDRHDGKLISAGKFSDNNNFMSGVDPQTGRPILLPSARYEDTPRLLSPNAVAAHSWQPMSYNPATGLVYFPVLETLDSVSARRGLQAREIPHQHRHEHERRAVGEERGRARRGA